MQLNVFPGVLVFWKTNIFLLSSLPNMIIDSVSCWVGSQWVGWLVYRWSVDLIKPRKNMFGVVISPDFFFFFIDDKEKPNLIASSSHLNL